ncbi:MAG: ABC transporter ATP-binding protein [Elusimicrobia bacterium]|nr:ABC transporter ATP-binding protein [Elusimicrobiota bacterium]
MSSAEIIRTENISKMFMIGSTDRYTMFNTFRYKLSGETPKKELWALKNINISVNKGDVVAIIGPNGAGKTTLLRIISGIMKATSGSYSVRGSVTSIFELGLGFNPMFTALQNVYLYGALHGLSRKKVDAILPKIVEFSGLEDFMGAKLSEFSSGMRSRLAFAMIIQTVEDIVLVDEIMAVGDISFQQKCLSTYEKMIEEGKTLIFVTQSLDGRLEEICTGALYINRGEQILYGPPEEATALYNRHSGIGG